MHALLQTCAVEGGALTLCVLTLLPAAVPVIAVCASTRVMCGSCTKVGQQQQR
jgi:hypothetical protein